MKKTKGHWPKGKRRNDGDPRQLGKLLKLARERRMTAEVARRLGVSRRTVYKWAEGDVPPQAMIDRLAKFLSAAKEKAGA